MSQGAGRWAQVSVGQHQLGPWQGDTWFWMVAAPLQQLEAAGPESCIDLHGSMSLAGSMYRPGAPPCCGQSGSLDPQGEAPWGSSCISHWEWGQLPHHGHLHPALWGPSQLLPQLGILIYFLIWTLFLTGKFGPNGNANFYCSKVQNISIVLFCVFYLSCYFDAFSLSNFLPFDWFHF